LKGMEHHINAIGPVQLDDMATQRHSAQRGRPGFVAPSQGDNDQTAENQKA